MLKRSQVAVEYLVIVAVALFLLIPIAGLFYVSSNESANSADSNLLIIMGRKIISESENVFYQGKNTKLKLSFNFPDNIQYINIKSSSDNSLYEFIIGSDFNGLATEMVFFSYVNLTFSQDSSNPCASPVASSASEEFISEGFKDVYVHSCGSYVTLYNYNG